MQSDPLFIDEALNNLDAIARALDPDQPETLGADQIEAVFRHAHSVKGGAAAFGLMDASELMHRVESVLDHWRRRRTMPDRQGVNLLCDSVALARAYLTGSTPDPALALMTLDRLRAAAHVRADGLPERHLLLRFDQPLPLYLEAAVTAIFRDIDGLGRVLAVTGDGAVQKVFEIQTSASESDLKDLVAMHLETSTLVIESADPALRKPAQVRLASPTMRHEELPSAPVAILFAAIPVLLSNMASLLGKQFKLSVSGQALKLQRDVIRALADPLIQLVRNACDHGIEFPHDRRGVGKAAEGRIDLSAEIRDDAVVIRVRDDGRGVSWDRLRQVARSRGISVAADAPDQSLLQLVFLPGLSTAGEVTLVSGRGVGMDVVRHNVEALGGRVNIGSVPGMGTCVELILPLDRALAAGR